MLIIKCLVKYCNNKLPPKLTLNQNFPTNVSYATYAYVIISNIIIWGQDLALFLSISPYTGDLTWATFSYAEQHPMIRYMLMPVSWSISLEFTFYIIAPYILRNKAKWVNALIIISLLSNVITNYCGLNSGNWRFRFFPSTLVFFLTGYYAYRLYSLLNKHKFDKKYGCLAILIAIVISLVFLNLDIPYVFHASFLLAEGLIFIPYLFYSTKTNRVDRFIGELSYPLYLIHPIFIGINELAGFDNNCFVIVGSLLGSIICYKFFIARLERFRSVL